MVESIVELERQFDRYLARPRVARAVAAALSTAAARWCAAVWAAAEAAGPAEIGRQEVLRAFEVAQCPIFIYGAHRSGTTLVRDLLDDHPALAVLPAEGSFFTNLEPRLRRQPHAQWLSWVGCEWLRRLANPIHQQPYWLLGSSAPDHSPYVQFARALMAWWPLTRERFSAQASSWPLLAVALAYAHCTGRLCAASSLRYWAEKTPTNERFLNQLRAQFPQARLIHVVRHPCAVFASHKYAEQQAGQRFRQAGRVLRDLDMSYRVALEQSAGRAADRYLQVRYEDVLDDLSGSSQRLAAFLGITPLPILMQPTVAGVAAPSNSSFTGDAAPGRLYPVHQKWRELLTASEQRRLVTRVGEAARALGYELPAAPAWRVGLLRLTTHFRGRVP